MHVQTIPKSPPKIIVQVAENCDFFFACRAKPGRATSDSERPTLKRQHVGDGVGSGGGGV